MRNVYLLIVGLFILSGSLCAQTLSERMELFDDGTFFYESEDYKEAIHYFIKLYDTDPENGNICFLVGMCYLNIPGEESLAIPYLEKAITKISYTYSKSTFQEVRAPLHAMFYLGNAYRINSQLDKALDMYDKFMNSPYFEGNYNVAIVQKEIDDCKRAKVIFDKPVKTETTNVGFVINDQNDNFNPVVTGNDSIMIFVTSLKFYDAIMMTYITDTGWCYPINITPQVGSDGDCYPTCLSYDGKELYMVKREKRNDDIYVSRWEDGVWTVMQPLNKDINSGKLESHASVSADGKYLYFSSEKGSKGGLDIFISERNVDGDWGKPENLGKRINTDYDENYPFISSDGQVLFFSSKGHNNMGGYDIFFSKKVNGEWTMPVNIGFPINTTADDVFYSINGNGVVSYRALIMDEGYGMKDIYKVRIIGGESLQLIKSRK
ncbi:MAG: PD40 domain-containing protein [Bacteroidales bacterium]|nr:PD40 domain-containing protein [Bacteroidales bacterium]